MNSQSIAKQPRRLYGVADFAELAGISTQRTYKVMQKPDFPAPYAVSRYGKLWTFAQFHEFLALWDRKAGRPKTDIDYHQSNSALD